MGLSIMEPHQKKSEQKMLETQMTYTAKMVVRDNDTALSVGSGDLQVLATPRMMALMENAAMKAVAPELPEGCTTVGGYIESSHLRPSAVGHTIEASATLTQIEGKKLTFDVCAKDGDTLIGEGKHIRFIVDKEKFLSRL